LIDEHPKHGNLFFATGGNGHAYKFLPVLGRLVVQRIKGTLSPATASKFAFGRNFKANSDASRPERQTKVLCVDELVTA